MGSRHLTQIVTVEACEGSRRQGDACMVFPLTAEVRLRPLVRLVQPLVGSYSTGTISLASESTAATVSSKVEDCPIHE